MPRINHLASRYILFSSACLMALAAGGAFGGANAVTQESQGYFEDAEALLKKGDGNAAVIQLKNAVKADADNLEARLLLGQYHLRRGDAVSAEKEFREARRRGMADEKVLLPLAQAYLLQGKSKDLLAEINPDKLTGQSKAIAHTIRARAFISEKDIPNAQAELDSARTDSENIESFFLAEAELFLKQDMPAEAEKSIDRSIEINPKFAPALFQKGELRRVQRDLDGAVLAYTATLDTEENYVPARLSRSIAYLGLKKFAEAEADSDALIKRLPDMPMARYVKAVVQSQRGEPGPALETLAPVEFRLADFLPAVYLLGSLNLQLNQLEGAARYAERYQIANPENVDAAKLLASVYARQKRNAESLRALQPFETQGSTDTGYLALLGNAYLANNDYASAGRVFEELQKLAPENSAVREQLAITRLGMGEKDQAVQELEALTDDAGGSDRANLLLILTHMRAKDYDKALLAAQNYAKNTEKNATAHNLIGSAYAAKGSRAEARAAFEKAIEIDPAATSARLNLAQLDRADNKPADAKAQLEKILSIDKGNERALLSLTDMAMQEKDADSAIKYLQQAIAENPKSETPRLNLIELQLRRDNPSAALQIASELSQMAPESPAAINAMAQVQIANKQIAGAVSSYRKLVSIVPESSAAHLLLAKAQALNNNLREAISSADEAIRVQPDFFEAREERVRMELKRAGAAAAETLAMKYRDAMPDKMEANALLGEIYLNNEKYPLAIEAFEKALTIEPSSKVALFVYTAHSRSGDPKSANQRLSDWIKQNPEDWQTRLYFSTELIRQGETDAAITENEALNEKFPGNPLILNNLGWLYMQRGDKRGIELASTAYKLAPESPEIQDTYGWMLVNEGRAAEAVPILRKASEKMPKNAEINYHYAAALDGDGKKAEARDVLQRLLAGLGQFNERPQAQKLYDKLKQAK